MGFDPRCFSCEIDSLHAGCPTACEDHCDGDSSDVPIPTQPATTTGPSRAAYLAKAWDRNRQNVHRARRARGGLR